MSNGIIFFGTEEFSAISLQALIDAGCPVVAVVTKQDTKKGRGKKLVPPTVKVIAEQHGIAVWQPRHLDEIIDDITALQPVAGVLVSFGKIIPQEIIDLFTPGIINVHPSKLPQYRGPSPIESALLNGDSDTGVSIMQLSLRMDAGPVYHCTPHALRGDETSPELYQTLGELGAQSLVTLLPEILNGTLQPQAQDDTIATYCQLIKKTDGIIDQGKPAVQLEREVRAYRGWPGSRTQLGGVDITITAAHVVDAADSSPLTLSCGDGSYLAIDALKPAGKKEMPAREFINGYGHLLS